VMLAAGSQRRDVLKQYIHDVTAFTLDVRLGRLPSFMEIQHECPMEDRDRSETGHSLSRTPTRPGSLSRSRGPGAAGGG
jgi:hypothetical protein